MLKALLSSRKFWLVLSGIIAHVVLVIAKAEPIATALPQCTALIGLLVAAIAHEDAADKRGPASLVTEALDVAAKAVAAGSVVEAAKVVAADVAEQVKS